MKVYKGDCWELHNHAIIIPINLEGVMGAGLALQAKLKFPNECAVDMKLRKLGRMETRFSPIQSPLPNSEGQVIQQAPYVGLIFLPTKIRWREDSSLTLISNSLNDLKQIIEHYNRPRRRDSEVRALTFKVAMPKIGCGLGRLDWEKQVLPLIWSKLDLVEDYVTLVDSDSQPTV